MAAERSKRVRLNVVVDVDFEPGTEQGFGGMDRYGRHVLSLLELDGGDYVDEDSGDNFAYSIVDVSVAPDA